MDIVWEATAALICLGGFLSELSSLNHNHCLALTPCLSESGYLQVLDLIAHQVGCVFLAEPTCDLIQTLCDLVLCLQPGERYIYIRVCTNRRWWVLYLDCRVHSLYLPTIGPIWLPPQLTNHCDSVRRWVGRVGGARSSSGTVRLYKLWLTTQHGMLLRGSNVAMQSEHAAARPRRFKR